MSQQPPEGGYPPPDPSAPPPGGGYPPYQPYGAPQGQPGQPGQPGQQVPYGQQPPPYGQQPPYGYPAAPYGQQPSGGSSAVKIVLIIVGVVVLLCGGVITAIVLAVGRAADEIDDAFNADYRGSKNDPIAVEEGEAFEIRGFEYDSGWTVAGGQLEDGITGLSVKNASQDGVDKTVAITFDFLADDEVVGEVSCYSSIDLAQGRRTKLDCAPLSSELGSYDSIEVYDESLFE